MCALGVVFFTSCRLCYCVGVLMEVFGFSDWIIFFFIVLVMLGLDILMTSDTGNTAHGKGRTHVARCSAICIIVAVAVSAVFALWICYDKGTQYAVDFMACYLLELSLSMDNMFVFVLIFNYMKISVWHQHKVLSFGVVGALILRLVFVYIGYAVLNNVGWAFYVLGVILLYSAYKTAFHGDGGLGYSDDINGSSSTVMASNRLLRLLRNVLPINDNICDGRFVTYDRINGGKFYFTPLFITLLLIEQADVLFAGESIVAALSITSELFIVFTSSIFAIMGLRSLYFFISTMLQSFASLHYGLAIIFAFIGGKMILDPHGTYCGTAISLVVIVVVILGLSIVEILRRNRQ